MAQHTWHASQHSSAWLSMAQHGMAHIAHSSAHTAHSSAHTAHTAQHTQHTVHTAHGSARLSTHSSTHTVHAAHTAHTAHGSAWHGTHSTHSTQLSTHSTAQHGSRRHIRPSAHRHSSSAPSHPTPYPHRGQRGDAEGVGKFPPKAPPIAARGGEVPTNHSTARLAPTNHSKTDTCLPPIMA